MKVEKIRVNEQIRATEIRLIGSNNEQVGIVTLEKGIELAMKEGFDLVEVAPDAKPPVCKLLDYGKHKYELSKKEKEGKKKQHVVVLKEIRMRPRTEDHDFDFKVRHARTFLEQKNKVKFTVQFRGRELAYKEFGDQLLDRVVEALEDIAKVESAKKFEGRSLSMTMVLK